MSFSITKNVKAQTVKDLGNVLAAMKDSLLITPEELSSKLHCKATAIGMKDSFLSFKKWMHLAMLIRWHISYAELLMGMIEADFDNCDGETLVLHAYYNELTKDFVG